MKKYLKILLAIIIIAIGAVYLYQNRSQMAVLANITATNTLLIIVLTLAFFYITGYTFGKLLLLIDVRLNHLEVIGLSVITNFGNYLGPVRPGAAIKAVYLKKYKDLDYSRFASIFAANGFLALFMTGITGLILLIIMGDQDIQSPPYLYYICIGLVGVSVLPFICRLPQLSSRHRLIAILRSAVEGFAIIKSRKVGLLVVCGTFISQFIMAAMINLAVYEAIGVQISFLLAVAIGVFTSIANLFTLTPNNLGVQEAVIAYIFSLAGFDFAVGLIGAAVARVIHMLITFTLAPIFLHYLFRSAR